MILPCLMSNGALSPKIQVNPMKMKYNTVLLLGLGMTLGLGIAKAENPASDSVAEAAKRMTSGPMYFGITSNN